MLAFLKKALFYRSFGKQSAIIIRLMLGLMLVTIFAAVLISSSNIRREEYIIESSLPVLNLSHKMINQINFSISQLNEYLLVEDEKLLKSYYKTNTEILDNLQHLQQKFGKNKKQEKILLRLVDEYLIIQRAAKNIIRLHKNKAANYPGLTLANLKMNPVYLTYLSILEEVRQEIQGVDINYQSKSEMLSEVNDLKYYFSQHAGALRIFLVNRNNEQLADIERYRGVVEEHHQNVEEIVDHLDIFTSEDLSPLWQEYQLLLNQLVLIYSSNQWRQDTWQMEHFVLPKLQSMQSTLHDFSQLNELVITDDIKNLTQQYQISLLFSLLVTLVILVLGYFSVRLIRAIIIPTVQLGKFIQGFSFFHPTSVPEHLVHERNEVGEFAKIFKNMLERLVETYEADKKIRLQMEYQWQALIQHELVLLLKPNGEISYVNGLLTELLSCQESELIGKSCYEIFIFADDSKNETIQSMQTAMQHNQNWTDNVSIEAKDSQRIYINLTIIPYFDLLGNTMDFLAIGTDISLLISAKNEIEENNRLLEHRVAERTQELLKINQELDHSYKQLMQSEKMASVGQLAAGVAHEINNPIGYVSSNMGTLKNYLQDLFNLLESYENRLFTHQGEQDYVAAEKQKYDFEYIHEDISDILKENHDGLERVKIIVQDLKNFSHSDTGEWDENDIHDILETTLNIAHNKLKYVASVVKNYTEIPHIRCNKSQLGQVFLNLIINAAQAIEKFGTITISTKLEEQVLVVSISDTGKGIVAENLDKIFDPFFTTKPVGTGTGLGLSLSYGIVEKHHGSIEVSSEVGSGTCFKIKFPISNPEEEAVDGRR